jgi:SAM-dependent methyltransferase
MLELTRQRLGAGAALHRAGLGGAPLPFPDGAFDDAIACLVLHYLEDWKAPLTELRRVLAPGGRLIVAVNHPFGHKWQYPDADYFTPREYSEEYTFSGQNAVLTYWHRPLHAMTAAFTEAGFRIAVISEPPTAPGARERFPEVPAEVFKGPFTDDLPVLPVLRPPGCPPEARPETAQRRGSSPAARMRQRSSSMKATSSGVPVVPLISA